MFDIARKTILRGESLKRQKSVRKCLTIDHRFITKQVPTASYLPVTINHNQKSILSDPLKIMLKQRGLKFRMA